MVEIDDKDDKYDHDDELEQALRRTLRPLAPPRGFAERVLVQAQESVELESLEPHKPFWLHPQLRWAVAAVLLLTVTFGAFWAHQRQRRIEGERARAQVLLALRITSITIRAVRNQVAADSHNNNGQQQETP